VANPEVGSRWEVAINDVGYMLADSPNDEMGYRRMTSTLDPQRFADGATPVSESIERYSFANSSEWRGGAGQRFLNRAASDFSSYWDSLGVDPFDDGQRLKLLPAAFLAISNTNTGLQAVAGSSYILQGAANASTWTVAANTATQAHSYTPGNLTDLDIGAGKGFIARGTDLQQLTLGASGLTELSTLDIHRVAWIGDRLAVLYRDSATSTWRFSTLAADGTEEIPGGLLTLPGATSATMSDCQYQLGGITPGFGFTWFSGWSAGGDEGHVYVWGNDVTLSASIALAMPRGEVALDLFFYQGGVYIYSVSVGTSKAKIYRCVVNGDGTLTPFLVVDDAGAAPADLARRGRKFAGSGRSVYFAWNGMAGANSGLGVIDLATGGYAKRTQALASGNVDSVYVWANRPGMSISGRGLYLEHTTSLVSSGWLRTSIFDADSALDKRWDSISWSQDVPTGTSMDISYTTNGGSTYTLLVNDTAATDGEISLGVEAPSLGLEILLNGTGTATPLVRVVAAKFHPVGLIDQLLILPINCSDRIADLKGAPILRAPHVGADQARALELLEGNYVTVQDVDWRQSQATRDYEVVQVDIRRWMQAYDRSQSAGRQSLVAVVTLRREILRAAVTGPSNAAPVITNPGTRNNSVNVAITPLAFAATDADSDTLVWGAVGLPPGLTMSPMGVVSGTPTETGAFTVTVYANDGEAQDSETLTWNIT
jgi:hypothetical protein